MARPEMREFGLIRRLQEVFEGSAGTAGASCVIGIGDDAAVLEPATGRQLVTCADTLVEGVHFPRDTSARAIGHKALAVNLSDLAAMGAEPSWFLLALTLPEVRPDWLDGFAQGMAELASRSGIRLVGGDTTTGPLNICVTALGQVERGRVLTRSGARPGDRIVVSGVPGRAAYALDELKHGREPEPAARRALEFPEPRLALGQALAGRATACIDISDGLAADLGHVIAASGVGAKLDLGSLPAAGALSLLPPQQRWAYQLSGGDDYELCFTVPPEELKNLDRLADRAEVGLNVVGEVTAGQGLVINTPDGGVHEPSTRGYEHFGAGARSGADS